MKKRRKVGKVSEIWAFYGTLEKETLALVTSIMNFRDMIEAAPITFIITDSQPLLWALKHRESNLKISRWVFKAF